MKQLLFIILISLLGCVTYSPLIVTSVSLNENKNHKEQYIISTRKINDEIEGIIPYSYTNIRYEIGDTIK